LFLALKVGFITVVLKCRMKNKKNDNELGVVVQACNPNTKEGKAGGLLL
jgi:hypothetical protein